MNLFSERNETSAHFSFIQSRARDLRNRTKFHNFTPSHSLSLSLSLRHIHEKLTFNLCVTKLARPPFLASRNSRGPRAFVFTRGEELNSRENTCHVNRENAFLFWRRRPRRRGDKCQPELDLDFRIFWADSLAGTPPVNGRG